MVIFTIMSKNVNVRQCTMNPLQLRQELQLLVQYAESKIQRCNKYEKVMHIFKE